MYNDAQKSIDSLRSEIYKDYAPEIQASAGAFLVQGECFCLLSSRKVYVEDNDCDTQYC